jgi:enoyl-CoA hydratase
MESEIENPADRWQHIRYERPAERVARIVLARPEMANAQDYRMISELNEAFDVAARDDEVRVIVLAADGNHFSSGHDLRAGTDMSDIDPIGTWCCFGADGAEGYMATEAEMYVGMCWRWRNIPKPTIAQVQGKVIAGGLMLVWPMDLVVCSDDATFADPVVAFCMNGHEYFTHAFEAGARLAKEMLFTGRAVTADEAYRRGMVNQVVPRDELEATTLALAEHIARRPMFGLTLAKQSVNNSLDAMGMYSAIQSGVRPAPRRPQPQPPPPRRTGRPGRPAGDPRRGLTANDRSTASRAQPNSATRPTTATASITTPEAAEIAR